MRSSRGKTVRGIGGDAVRVLRDNASNASERWPRPTIFVTSSERDASSHSGRIGICSMFTPEQALKLADVLRELATEALS